MSTIPAGNYATFWGADTTFQWSGATYKTISDATLKYGNKIKEEAVTGTDLPYYGTGVWHGELDIKAVGSSDNNMWNSAVSASGIIPTMGFVMQDQDTSGAMASLVWRFSGKITEFSMKWSKDNYVGFDLKAILVSKPTVFGS